MRHMTEQEAEFYIKAGYFPKSTDREAIVELQDIFGQQRFWAIHKWLYEEDTYQNALTLYKLIWNKDDVERFVNTVNSFINNVNELADVNLELTQLKEKLSNLEKMRDKLARRVDHTHKSMYNIED